MIYEAPNGGAVVDACDEGALPELTSVAVASADVQAALQPWIGMECFQLSQGRRLSAMTVLDLGDRQIVREAQDAAIQKLGATPANLCTVSCCTPMPGFRFSEIASGEAAEVFFMPGGTEFDIFIPAGAMTTYVSFDQDAFLESARALDPEGWADAPAQLTSFAGVRQDAFLSGIAEIVHQAEALAAAGTPMDPAALRELVLQNVLMTTVASVPADAAVSGSEQRRAFEVCRNARDYITARLAVGAVPTIPELCTAVNVAERTLQYAFRRYVGMTPLAYLRVCRLNRVRSELLAPGAETTVTAVAMKYGFIHLSRFSGDYQKLFGELPSATLTR